MKKEDLWNVYTSEYAKSYDEEFLTNPFSKLSLDFEMNVLKKELNPDSTWLDLGCGTGYFLSQFPGIKRAGLDISPGMLQQAMKVSPDSVLFKEGDFRERMPEWDSKWSFISCMWGASHYVDSIFEVENVISNIINWLSEDGSFFLPILDLEDIRPNKHITYKEDNGIYKGSIYVTSVTWRWVKKDLNHVHEHMVAPHIEHFIELLKPHFDSIQILRYPPYVSGWVSRKAILAKGKRKAITGREAKVTWDKIPDPVHKTPGYYESPGYFLSNANLFKELVLRFTSGRIFLDLIRKLKS
jgi:SAM-dependent methyltransferase